MYVPFGRDEEVRLQVVGPVVVGDRVVDVGAGDLVDELPVDVAEAVPGVVGDDEIGVVGVATEEVDLLGGVLLRRPALERLAGTLPQNGQGWVPSPGEVGNSERVFVSSSPWYNSFGWLGLVAAS